VETRGRGLSLRLFVAGDSPESAVAIANLEALYPRGEASDVHIEIVDVQREPAKAAREGIVVTPTLLKLSPFPPLRILGNLKNRANLASLLGDAAIPPGRD
jgi:circadian clock protein KaiB